MEASTDRDVWERDPLTAIVFSAATLEAFINEAAMLAAQRPNPHFSPTPPPSVRIFADLLDEVERSRGSIQLKFLLAKSIFTGESYNKGTQPYQDFDLLIRLRNELVHLRPKENFEFNPESGMSVKPAPIIEKLRSRNILAEHLPNASLILLVSTRASARWACNTAAAMIQSVLEFIPESEFKSFLDLSYARFIQPVS
jgi:hypothetical protein